MHVSTPSEDSPALQGNLLCVYTHVPVLGDAKHVLLSECKVCSAFPAECAGGLWHEWLALLLFFVIFLCCVWFRRYISTAYFLP